MKLPSLKSKPLTLVIPSTQQEIQYRPFSVREEKVLSLVLTKPDTKSITKGITEVLNSCITTKDVDVRKLSIFDIEYLFLNIRGKSIGNTLRVVVTCPDDDVTRVSSEINIDDVKVISDSTHSKHLTLNDEYSLEMKYPSLDTFVKINFVNQDVIGYTDSIELVASCVSKIYSQDEIYSTDECTSQEVVDFLEQLTNIQFKEIEKFFETIPKLSHQISVTNPNTGSTSLVLLQGLSSFFSN